MPGRALTTLSTMLCPHGGSVSATAAGLAQADGGTVLTMADMCVISGCPFQLPTTPPTPSPCLMVQWVSGEPSALASNMPALSESSVGLCIAATGLVQGTVQVVATQATVMIG
jgi:hypothetical protein